MCLSVLTDAPVSLLMHQESIFVDITEGEPHLLEVHDLFIHSFCDVHHATLVCISSHDLLRGNQLGIKAHQIIGAGSPEDIVYTVGSNNGATFNPRTNEVEIDLLVPPDPSSPERTRESYTGKAFCPGVSLPDDWHNDPDILEVMHGTGTIFKLDTADMPSGTTYAIRLSVEPGKLLTFPMARSVPASWDSFASRNIQQGVIFGPRTCLFNIDKLLSAAETVGAFVTAAAKMRDAIRANRLRLLVPARQRILLIADPTCEIFPAPPRGPISLVGQYFLPDNRIAIEWLGGTKTYWADDPKAVCQHIVEYLRVWAAVDPKRKEEVTAALNISHADCSSMIDCLTQAGILECTGTRYKARGSPDHKAPAQEASESLEQICYNMENSLEALRAFRSTDYEATYQLKYYYLSYGDRKERHLILFRNRVGFWSGLLGAILGMLSLIVALLALGSHT